MLNVSEEPALSTLFKDQSKKLEFTTQSLSFTSDYSILQLSEKELSSLRHIIRDKYIKNLRSFVFLILKMMKPNNLSIVIIFASKIILKFGKATKNIF